MSFVNFWNFIAGNSKWKRPGHQIEASGRMLRIPAIQHDHYRALRDQPADRSANEWGLRVRACVVTASPSSAFWYAASLARDPRALDGARRRALTTLLVLALRRDRIGSQAAALLNGTHIGLYTRRGLHPHRSRYAAKGAVRSSFS